MNDAANLNTLSTSRIDDAFTQWRNGRRFNCWGATLFVLNVLGRPVWAEQDVMEAWLEQNAKPVYRPRPGDVVTIYNYGTLSHTAVCLGKGRYFHKKGSNIAEVTDLAGVKRTYSGTVEFMRVNHYA